MIGRIGDRNTFAELRRRGQRARSGPVSICHVGGRDGNPPRVAYGVGRPVGNAVTRNRLRRRLRGAMGALAQAESSPVGPGAYLIGADRGALTLSHQELVESLARVLRAVHPSRPHGTRR
ncbi:MAG: ribonuclease P protein component [Acidimicrobiales bacterium]